MVSTGRSLRRFAAGVMILAALAVARPAFGHQPPLAPAAPAAERCGTSMRGTMSSSLYPEAAKRPKDLALCGAGNPACAVGAQTRLSAPHRESGHAAALALSLNDHRYARSPRRVA